MVNIEEFRDSVLHGQSYCVENFWQIQQTWESKQPKWDGVDSGWPHDEGAVWETTAKRFIIY